MTSQTLQAEAKDASVQPAKAEKINLMNLTRQCVSYLHKWAKNRFVRIS